ncbi:MAG: hypothetical protein FJX83_04300 [Bacteroidetes bacterium]|nr:hypothetical protein [Bacteroidota bacterium]
MLKRLFLSSIVFLVFAIAGCEKGGDGGTPPPPPTPEESIAFSFDPDPGSASAVSTVDNYPYTVKVSSKLPASGVHVDHATQLDTDNSTPTYTRVSSTSSSIALTTAKLDPGKLYRVTVVVTSQNKSSNSVSKTFKVAKK